MSFDARRRDFGRNRAVALVVSLADTAGLILVPLSLFGAGIVGLDERLGPLLEALLLVSGVLLFLLFSCVVGFNKQQLVLTIATVTCLISFSPAVVVNTFMENSINVISLRPLLRIAVICGWILFLQNVDWNRNVRNAILGFGLAVCIPNILLWGAEKFPVPFSGLAPHKNVLATVGFVGLTVSLLQIRAERRRQLYILLFGVLALASVILLFASGGRKALIGVAVSALVYFVVPSMRRNLILKLVAFVGVIVFAFMFIQLYLNFESYSLFWRVDDFLLSTMNQDLYTGREVVWPDAISKIELRPWIGYGEDYECRVGRFRDKGLSAHNLYLAVLYQSGGIGLVGFLSLLLVLWLRILSEDGQRRRLVAAFFIGALVTQYFTTTLLQNLLGGLGIWTVLAYGACSETKIRVREDEGSSDSEIERKASG